MHCTALQLCQVHSELRTVCSCKQRQVGPGAASVVDVLYCCQLHVSDNKLSADVPVARMGTFAFATGYGLLAAMHASSLVAAAAMKQPCCLSAVAAVLCLW